MVADWVMPHFTLNPGNTALIVVDMQNCFVEDSPFAAPGGRGVLDRLNRLARTCRAVGGLVVHTAQVVREDGSSARRLRLPERGAG
jgi:ureidoacrylate peracid hydrolase